MIVKARVNHEETTKCFCGGTAEYMGTLKHFYHYHCNACGDIIHIKKDLGNYKLTSFTPVYINIHKVEVSKKEFEKERERLQKPYFDLQKKEGKKPLI